MTCLSIIVAVARNRVIGVNNSLPWHLPEDLKRFRALTMGHHIIMGRKTYQSLGRLLPGRTTVIVTRNADYHVDGAIIAHTLADAINACADDSEVFLIGGAELFESGLPLADKLYLTSIDASYDGDVFFPEFAQADWRQVSQEAHVSESGLAFHYINYTKQ